MKKVFKNQDKYKQDFSLLKKASVVFQDQMRIKKVLTEGGPTLTTFQWGGYIVVGADPIRVFVGISAGVRVRFFVSVHYLLNQLMDFDQTCIYTLLG